MDLQTLELLHKQYETFKTSMKSEKVGLETEPPWDRAPAKVLLDSMIETIGGCLEKAGRDSNEYNRLLAMKGALHYQHAKILVQLSQMEMARDILKTCIDFLKDFFLAPEVTFLGLRVLNHYCYLLTKCGDLDQSQELLEQAESKYLALKERGDVSTLPLYSNDDLFEGKFELTPNKEVNKKLEKLVTNNLQMLGYVYNKKGDLDKFALYHHQVLRRQLDMREGDATVWAMKTARLGYFFLTRNKFTHARHHLAAASYVLSQYENTLKTLNTSDLVLSKWDELNHRYADIAKCWVRYGLFLFNASKMKLVSAFYGDSSPFLDNAFVNPLESFLYGCNGAEENEEASMWSESESKVPKEDLRCSLGSTNLEETEETAAGVRSPFKGGEMPFSPSEVFDVIFETSNPSNISIHDVGVAEMHRPGGEDQGEATGGEGAKTEGELPEEGNKKEDNDEHNFRFPNLDLNCFENCVSCNYVDGLQSARALFLFTHSWLKKSKLFYTLKDHPMEYVNVILDLSELYRYLAFYEDDIENQYSVQKRRADTLETLSAVLKEVRPQCYIAISIELFRELAEIHLELMGLNLRRLYLAQPEVPKEGETKPSGDYFGNMSDYAFHKMEAIADMHRRLYQLSDVLGHGALGDFESACAMSSVDSDIHDDANSTLFESCQTPDMKLLKGREFL